ncbi:MAG: hypothetical protein BWZ03_00768 [bacterium ADurb.BinA186]|nr:MAG: hypothetical protein BWZ03_00768 [bacterium ADurb.BinA186]
MIAHNEIETLPQNINNLHSLEYFNARKNKLNSLPNNITKLTHIKSIILDKNNLSSLPENIYNLTTTTLLVLSNNPLTNPPEGIDLIPNAALFLGNPKDIFSPAQWSGWLEVLILNDSTITLYLDQAWWKQGQTDCQPVLIDGEINPFHPQYQKIDEAINDIYRIH